MLLLEQQFLIMVFCCEFFYLNLVLVVIRISYKKVLGEVLEFKQNQQLFILNWFCSKSDKLGFVCCRVFRIRFFQSLVCNNFWGYKIVVVLYNFSQFVWFFVVRKGFKIVDVRSWSGVQRVFFSVFLVKLVFQVVI